MRTVRWIAGTAALIAVLTVLSGHASSLNRATNSLAANKASVTRCDTDGVTVVQNLTGVNVVSVTVSGIAAACATATLSLTVNNGLTNSSGSGAVPAGGGSMTVTLALPVAARDAEQTDIAVSGP